MTDGRPERTTARRATGEVHVERLFRSRSTGGRDGPPQTGLGPGAGAVNEPVLERRPVPDRPQAAGRRRIAGAGRHGGSHRNRLTSRRDLSIGGGVRGLPRTSSPARGAPPPETTRPAGGRSGGPLLHWAPVSGRRPVLVTPHPGPLHRKGWSMACTLPPSRLRASPEWGMPRGRLLGRASTGFKGSPGRRRGSRDPTRGSRGGALGPLPPGAPATAE